MYCSTTITHTIRPGDTIYRIAKQHQTTVPEIMALNPNINPYNLQVGSIITVCESSSQGMTNGDELELNQDLRRALEQLTYWIRMYLMSAADDLKDQSVMSERLEKIPAMIAEIFRKYYPRDVTSRLQQLLNTFIDNLMQLVSSVKDGEPEQTDELDTDLEQTADALAQLFGNMNINYDTEKLRRALNEYLLTTKREIVGRLSGEYAEELGTFDEAEKQALNLADYLSDGIMRQYYRGREQITSD